MKIGIASDHAGFNLKELLKKNLLSEGYQVEDFGTHSTESMDYPDAAHPLGVAVENNTVDKGIALCGTGNGICMTLNKHQGVRAALCWSVDIVRLAREHNNANVCCLPARFLTDAEAQTIVDTFLSTAFDGGRHSGRIAKIPCQ